MSNADKRIQVTESTRDELHALKESGQTYEELLGELTQQRRRNDLEQRFQTLDAADADELTPLEDG